MRVTFDRGVGLHILKTFVFEYYSVFVSTDLKTSTG